MGSKKIAKYKPGSIFWAESEGVGQEEQLRHPWIVISRPSVETECDLVVAVPMTSNPISHNEFTIGVYPSDVERLTGGVEPGLKEGEDGTVKCHKVRHWSVERMGEVIGRVHLAKLQEIRRIVADVFALPSRKRK